MSLNTLLVGESVAALAFRFGAAVANQKAAAEGRPLLKVRPCLSPSPPLFPLAVFLPPSALDLLGGMGAGFVAAEGQPIHSESRVYQFGHTFGKIATPGAVAMSRAHFRNLLLSRLSATGGDHRLHTLDRFEINSNKIVNTNTTNNNLNNNNNNLNNNNNNKINSMKSIENRKIKCVLRPDIFQDASFDLVVAADGHFSKIREQVFRQTQCEFSPSATWQAVVQRPPSVDAHSVVDVWANSTRLRWMPLERDRLFVSAVIRNQALNSQLLSGRQSARAFLAELSKAVTCARAAPIFDQLAQEPSAPCQVLYTRVHSAPLFYDPASRLQAAALGAAAASLWPGGAAEGLLEVEDAAGLLRALSGEGEEALEERLGAFGKLRALRYERANEVGRQLYQQNLAQRTRMGYLFASWLRRFQFRSGALRREYQRLYES